MIASPPPNNPLSIARESMHMGKESGDRTFKLVALVMMASAGMATLLHAAHMVWRDLRDDVGHKRGSDHPLRAAAAPRHDADSFEQITSDRADGSERKWTQRAEQTGRPPRSEHAHAEHHRQQSHVR